MGSPRLLLLILCLHVAAARPGHRAPQHRQAAAKILPVVRPKGPAEPRRTLEESAHMDTPAVDPRALARLRLRLEEYLDMNTPVGEQAVVVRFDLSMNKLLRFDQVQGVARWSVFFRLLWNDERLVFNGTEEFGESWKPPYDSISLSTEHLWTPDVVPFYSSSTRFENYGCSLYDGAFLQANGYNIMWSRSGVIDVPCDMNLEMFPFDEQQCALVVGPWSDRSYRLRALHDGNVSNEFSGDLNSEEWQVTAAFMETSSQVYINGILDEVHYTLMFRRFPHYYVVNAVLPMALIVVLSLMTMWLPIEGGSGERLGFSVGLLLTIMATALFTAEFRPATREDTWMDHYQASCLLLTFIPVFESVIIVWLQFIWEKVGSHEHDGEFDDLELHGSADGGEGPGAHQRPPRSRLSRTITGIVSLSSMVHSRELVLQAKSSMQAKFRMKAIVFLVQKLPSFEWIITGGRGKDPVSPRTLDVWARHGSAVLALVVAGQMVFQIPIAPDARSIHVLLLPICTGGIFYMLSASLAALFLLFRVSVLCSEVSVAKAREMMHLAPAEPAENEANQNSSEPVDKSGSEFEGGGQLDWPPHCSDGHNPDRIVVGI